MEAKNAKYKKSTFRTWLPRILKTLAVIILLPIALFTLGWLNRDTIINELQDWYSENSTGTFTVEKVNTTFLSGFPKVEFILKNITHTSTDTITDINLTLHIDEAKLIVGAGNLLIGNIKFENISINNARITSEVISKRSLEYHEQLRRLKSQTQQKGLNLPEWLAEDGAAFSIYNVKYIGKDSISNRYFDYNIHEIEGFYKGKDLQLSGSAFFDVTINKLGFNTKKGSFSNGARLVGKPKFMIDIQNDQIEIPEFPLRIDEQNFRLNAQLNLSELDSYLFNFQNDKTDYKAVKGLLTDSIAVKMENFDIQKPFKSTVKIAGNFAYGNDPDILATFSTKNNDLIISNKLHLKNASFGGCLTTDIYETDEDRKAKKSSKDIKIAFDRIEADLEDAKVLIQHGYYQNTRDVSNFVEATILLDGSNESLTRIIKTENFDFKGGRFRLNAAIAGEIPNMYHFLNIATGHFNLEGTQVILKKNGLQLPIQNINLELAPENSYLKQLVINLPNGENLVLYGQLKNLSGLLSKEPGFPTTSQIFLDSKNLNVNELIATALQFIPKSDLNKNNRKTLHETLDAVYTQFHPQFGIRVDTLQYNDHVIHNLKSGITLLNSETILLRNFDFKYYESSTSLNGNLIIYGPESKFKDAIYMDAEATSSGSIAVFKELFNIELFHIDSGEFQFQGKVNGNVKRFSELLNNARGDLALTNTKLYYEPADMEVVIDSISLFLDNSDILLNKFSLEVDEQTPLNLTGSIKQFPSFLLNDVQNAGSMALKIQAPFVNVDDVLNTIKSFDNENADKELRTKKAMHSLFKDMYKFYPEIELDIDSLQYDGLITENLKAAIYFENDSILRLNHLDVTYKDTKVYIEGTINAHSSKEDLSGGNPFDLDFFVKVKGKSEDLNDYLKTTNFIFQSGDFEFVGNYNAQSEDLNIMNSKTFGDLKLSNTRIDYTAANLQIPVDSLHLEINDDLATLKNLDIKLPGKSAINFSGSIDHFSEFINNSYENSIHKSNFSIHSPYLNTDDLKEFLKNATLNNETPTRKETDLQKLKDAMVKINTSFYPTLGVKIDTLKHKDFTLTDFGMDLLFDDTGKFKIEDTQLDFHGGAIALTMEVDLKTSDNLPVTIDMKATDVDIHELVTGFDYFNDADLRATDTIEGMLDLHLKAIGALDNDGKVKLESLNGTLELQLKDFELFNYKPIIENSVMMKDERFEKLRFRPIVQTFEIRDGVLLIPQTEIQSSAIHVFVEGKVKFDEYIDVWLSLPWRNLKSKDGLTLPEKTTFAKAGSKFYLQLVQDKNHEKERKQKLNVKVRLSNRQLQKEK
ncbi:AsmA-like C-terminal region-containing protein [Gillisia sp. Q332]|uniref:AsmA-like C-terminal region-containing protein n=1 Tax=Gillisia xinjiangensis TaxID=3384765 RepID=UPI003919BC84